MHDRHKDIITIHTQSDKRSQPAPDKDHSKTMEVQWFSFSHPRKSSTQTLLIPLLHSDHPTVYLARSVPISLCKPNLSPWSTVSRSHCVT